MADAVGRLFVAGVDHRSVPLEVREALTPHRSDIPALLRALPLDEVMMLTTCDRVELLGFSENPELGRAAFLSLAGDRPVDPYLHVDEEALRHLCRVASSLEAQVIGESHILGQIRAADRSACEIGVMGPRIRQALDIAYRAAKRVRHETTIAEYPVSLAAVAVHVAADLHGDLPRCTGLLLGCGEMGEYLADRLRQSGLHDWRVIARIEAQARAAAQRLGGHITDICDLAAVMPAADIVIAAMGSGRFAIDRSLVRDALRRRKNRPMLLVDVGQPMDIDGAVGELDQAFLYRLDDLESMAMRGRRNRAAAQEPALAIVEQVLVAARLERKQRKAAPISSALRAHAERVRQMVLAESGNDAERATSLLLARLLHRPYSVLRDAARGDDDLSALERSVRRLFDLNDEMTELSDEMTEDEERWG